MGPNFGYEYVLRSLKEGEGASVLELKTGDAIIFRRRYRSTTIFAGQNIDFIEDLNLIYLIKLGAKFSTYELDVSWK